MISYNIELDQEAIADAVSLFEFVGGNTSDAIRIAINKSAPKIRTKTSAAIRGQVRLAAGYVNERLTIVKATRNKLSGAIRTPSRGILLSNFATNLSKFSTVAPKVRVKPDGPLKTVTGDNETLPNKPFFMVLPKSGVIGIAARKKSGGIKVFHGPSLSQVFNTVRDDVLPEASAEYQAQLLDAMRYILTKKYPPEP